MSKKTIVFKLFRDQKERSVRDLEIKTQCTVVECKLRALRAQRGDNCHAPAWEGTQNLWKNPCSMKDHIPLELTSYHKQLY